MPEAPNRIKQLVEKYKLNYIRYNEYKEEQIKQEFINPLFDALGWDIYYKDDIAPQYRDVIFEDSLKINKETRAPDYCFQLPGKKMFFVEAKKPSVNIKEKKESAFQVRSYAWSAKLPLSILTDFEELAIYDTRVKPNKRDKAEVARLDYFTYEEYVDRWDDIYNIFSKEAVLKGSFDQYAEDNKKKHKTQEVDEAFLLDLEDWRELLAKNIALRNPETSIEELNYSVQQILDRIVFFRMCEDRRIEKYGMLRSLLEGTEIYRNFCELCIEADEKYNSGLFHFKVKKGRETIPDQFTLDLKIDDGIFKIIFTKLYYPESPYIFNFISPEILGHAYEQFLGKVIRLTDGHRAKVEEKPEVKKAGGVYYTPQYIVDYIVNNTIGKLIRGRTPTKVSELKILDPACGSGSFLLGAYKYLLKWHLNYYTSLKTRESLTDKIYQYASDEYRLTIREKKRILTNNIYGVDIDAQAVEVTKLSLLLKVLEDESRDELEEQKTLFKERALPNLDNNIRCGNSLITPDIYENDNLELCSTDIQNINAFNWETEFSEIMDNNGFDVVIGNPPYIRIQRIGHLEADYIYDHYDTPTSKTDLSQIFLELSLNLSKKNGLIGFICTSQWLATDYGKNMRKKLSEGKLHEIVDFGSLPVFQKASTYPAIFLLSPTNAKKLRLKHIESLDQLNLKSIESSKENIISFDNLSENPWNLGNLDIFEKLKREKIIWQPLKYFGQAFIGALTGMDKAFVVDEEIIQKYNLEKSILFPYAYRGAEIFRYTEAKQHSFIIYPYTEGEKGSPVLLSESVLKTVYPNIYNYLKLYKSKLRERKDSRKLYASFEWYRYLRPGTFKYIRPRKLVVKGIDKKVIVGILKDNTAFNGANCPGIILDNLETHSLLYLFGLLNSKVLSYHLKMVCPSKLSGYTRFNATNINKTPIRIIDFQNPEDVISHNKIVKFVEQMLKLYKNLETSKIPTEIKLLKSQIDATDKQIDNLVYELYGLTEEEIKIVEAV